MSMDAIKTLRDEHRSFLRILSALEEYVARLTGEGAAEPADLARFVHLFREYVDVGHHEKEEGALFPALWAHGFAQGSGPTAVMLHEHETGRALVRALAELAGRVAAWTEADRAQVAVIARRYLALLEAHIEKENEILFRMAELRLPESALAELGERFALIAAERDLGPLERLAGELVARYSNRGEATVHDQPW